MTEQVVIEKVENGYLLTVVDSVVQTQRRFLAKTGPELLTFIKKAFALMDTPTPPAKPDELSFPEELL